LPTRSPPAHDPQAAPTPRLGAQRWRARATSGLSFARRLHPSQKVWCLSRVSPLASTLTGAQGASIASAPLPAQVCNLRSQSCCLGRPHDAGQAPAGLPQRHQVWCPSVACPLRRERKRLTARRPWHQVWPSPISLHPLASGQMPA
jgi:hypothetical protein